MPAYLLSLLLGITAGLRALMPLAAVSWAAKLGYLRLENTWLAFLGASPTAYIFSVLALLELVNDKRPQTPSRKTPPQFITRIVTGAFSGAAVGMGNGSLPESLVAGALGAVLGTLGGAALRTRLAQAFGKDLPAALLEDVLAILIAVLSVQQLP